MVTSTQTDCQALLGPDPRPKIDPSSGQKSLAHHKVPLSSPLIYRKRGTKRSSPLLSRYGVPSSQRIISPGLLLKHFAAIVRFLGEHWGFSPPEREGLIRLLRLWCCYGVVYPKASQAAELPGCSKRTFWRMIAKAIKMDLIVVINRFIQREEAQISNLYRLDKLLIVLARYLAEHGVRFSDAWIQPFLRLIGSVFWGGIRRWRFSACTIPPGGGPGG